MELLFLQANIRKMKFLTLVLIMVLNLGLSYSQTKISMMVRDSKNLPVEYANFRLFSTQDSSVVSGGYSDDKGNIFIENIVPGKYYGIITAYGFVNQLLPNITVKAAQPILALGKITLDNMKSQELEEVEIQGKSSAAIENSIDKRTYNVEEDMTSAGGSVTDVLNNIPSIEVDSDGNISLRGNGSVTILIDGRESVLSSGDGALNGIPASAIERIEVVTNPSSKYNPDGTAGIINIILKKKKLRGFNFDVQANIASENLYNGSINFNYRNEKLNFYTSYSMRYREGHRNNFTDRTSLYNDTTEYLKQRRIGSDLERGHVGKIGIDFYLDSNQVLGISASGNYTDRNRGGLQNNYLYLNDTLTQFWKRDTYEPRNRISIDINADYKLDFKDKKGNLYISAMESLGDSKSTGDYEEYFFHSNEFINPYLSGYQRQGKKGNSNRFTFKTDLERQVNDKISYETGIQAIIYRMNDSNSYIYFDTVTQQEMPDLNADNKLLYDENIFSAYGSFSHTVTNYFSYKAGLRLEQAFSQPKLIKTNQKFNRNYFSYFPSIHLLFGTDKIGKFTLSYARRINRPDGWSISPFPTYDDPLNLRIGNPGLMPEYINSFEVGYEKNFTNFSVMTTFYFRQTENKIQRIRKFYDNGVSAMTFSNINQSYDYGLELVGSYSPFTWWKNMFSFNAYESRLSANVDGVVLSNKGISWGVKLNTTFSLFNNTTKIQINAQYVAPKYGIQGKAVWQPGIDAGITKSLLDKHLEIGVKVTDIFNMQHFYSEMYAGNITQTTTFEWTSRRLYLTVSYKFRNITMKEKKQIPSTGESGGEPSFE